MKKASDWFLIGCFAVFVTLCAGWTLTHTGETTSYFENRALAKPPAATASALGSGVYFDDWESFFTDHAAGRDTLLRADTLLRCALRLPVVNDVVRADGTLLPYIAQDAPNERRIAELADNMADGLSALAARVRDAGGRFYYIGVPEQYSYYADRYPPYLQDGQTTQEASRAAFSAALAARDVPFLDFCTRFKAAPVDGSLYFDTDHHYTVYGALEVYDVLTARLAEDGVPVAALSRDDWTLTTLPNPFLGSRGRKLYGLCQSDDALTYAVPRTPVPFTRTNNGAPSDTILSLPENDRATVTYSVFMGGDYAETIIQTHRPGLPRVLIYGDSFSNALEALLYCSCDELRSLDLRHYTEKSLGDYIGEYRPDVVLCVRDNSFFLDPSGNGATE